MNEFVEQRRARRARQAVTRSAGSRLPAARPLRAGRTPGAAQAGGLPLLRDRSREPEDLRDELDEERLEAAEPREEEEERFETEEDRRSTRERFDTDEERRSTGDRLDTDDDRRSTGGRLDTDEDRRSTRERFDTEGERRSTGEVERRSVDEDLPRFDTRSETDELRLRGGGELGCERVVFGERSGSRVLRLRSR